MGFYDEWHSVNRIAQTESNKLAKLPELIEGKVIGPSDENCVLFKEIVPD
jgi:ATP-dependent Clp protease ATP-binding subunit ClpC